MRCGCGSLFLRRGCLRRLSLRLRRNHLHLGMRAEGLLVQLHVFAGGRRTSLSSSNRSSSRNSTSRFRTSSFCVSCFLGRFFMFCASFSSWVSNVLAYWRFCEEFESAFGFKTLGNPGIKLHTVPTFSLSTSETFNRCSVCWSGVMRMEFRRASIRVRLRDVWSGEPAPAAVDIRAMVVLSCFLGIVCSCGELRCDDADVALRGCAVAGGSVT